MKLRRRFYYISSLIVIASAADLCTLFNLQYWQTAENLISNDFLLIQYELYRFRIKYYLSNLLY
jgi:hypothetical protein